MALRVLLADESSTIKRVMQLSLQDFGVEVKAVPLGTDVLQTSLVFQPDIIFIDVLLAKKNGYEVAAELKSNPQLGKIPLVMMWSGFMEIDEQKLKAAKVDKKLEKPFDADSLRNTVKALVPKLSENAISDFLNFSTLPEFVEMKNEISESLPQKTSAAPSEEAISLDFDQNLEEPEEFQSVPLPKAPPFQKGQITQNQASDEDWNQADLSKFKLDISSDEEFPFESQNASDDLLQPAVSLNSEIEEISLEEFDKPQINHKHSPSAQFKSLPSIDPVRAEEILKEEARKVLEKIAWKVMPDILERVVREELQKLLKDAEHL